MLRTRCPYCGRPFSISREEAGAILAQALAANARYGTRECPFCRRVVKIGLAELRRAAPAPVEAPAGAEAGPEAPAPSAAPSPAPAPQGETAEEPEALEPVTPSTGETPSLEGSIEPLSRRRGKRTKGEKAEASSSAPRRARAHRAGAPPEEEKPEPLQRPRNRKRKAG